MKRNEKGITLVALIITILILVVLATVAILAIQKENIISYADNASLEYKQSQTDEEDVLKGYFNTIDVNAAPLPDTLHYTVEEINKANNLWAIGTEYNGLSVVAKYTSSTQTLTIEKNINNSNGEMKDFKYNSTDAWFGNNIKTSIKKVVVENGVENVSSYAFSGLTNLQEVVLADSVTSIGGNAFASCSSLIKINIPSSVKTTGWYILDGTNDNLKVTFGEKFDITSSGISEVTFSEVLSIFEDYGSGEETRKSVYFGSDPNKQGEAVFKFMNLTINGKTRSMAKKNIVTYTPAY